MYLRQSPMIDGYWIGAKDGDPRVLALYERHYSAYQYADKRVRKLCVGPGYKMVLMTVSCDALYIWRKCRMMDGQQGVNCSVFRNESPILSSALIQEAMVLAATKWPGERLFTYVSPSAVGGDGACFKHAGWRRVGRTAGRKLKSGEKRGRLYILEYVPQIDKHYTKFR